MHRIERVNFFVFTAGLSGHKNCNKLFEKHFITEYIFFSYNPGLAAANFQRNQTPLTFEPFKPHMARCLLKGLLNDSIFHDPILIKSTGPKVKHHTCTADHSIWHYIMGV
jgi:hypothetical protein